MPDRGGLAQGQGCRPRRGRSSVGGRRRPRRDAPWPRAQAQFAGDQTVKTAFIISMYDEHDLVLASIKAIRSIFPHAVFVVSHSDDGTCTPALAEIRLLAASYDL